MGVFTSAWPPGTVGLSRPELILVIEIVVLVDFSSCQLFIKGVVNQEAQKEVQYPHALHCVFCGARGLFIDCLVRNTSAHIVVSRFVRV